MICVILVAAIRSRLTQELEESDDPRRLHGLPRSLLPVDAAGTSLLDHWWEIISQERAITQVYIVTNAVHYKHFERWATARGLPVENVVNNGCTDEGQAMGAASDLLLGLRRAQGGSGSSNPQAREPALVIAGDSIFYKEFDLRGVLNFYKTKAGTSHRLGLDPRAGWGRGPRGFRESRGRRGHVGVRGVFIEPNLVAPRA